MYIWQALARYWGRVKLARGGHKNWGSRRFEKIYIFLVRTVTQYEPNQNRRESNCTLLVINLSRTTPSRTVDIFQFRFRFENGTGPNLTMPTPNGSYNFWVSRGRGREWDGWRCENFCVYFRMDTCLI